MDRLYSEGPARRPPSQGPSARATCSGGLPRAQGSATRSGGAAACSGGLPRLRQQGCQSQDPQCLRNKLPPHTGRRCCPAPRSCLLGKAGTAAQEDGHPRPSRWENQSPCLCRDAERPVGLEGWKRWLSLCSRLRALGKARPLPSAR